MRQIEVAARSAIFVAIAAATWSTWHAVVSWPPRYATDNEPWFHLFNATFAWLVAALALGAWSKRPVWAGWATGFAALGAAMLAFATVDSGVVGIVALHGVTALLLAPMVVHRLRGWSLLADLRQHRLRWVTVVVAALVGAAANLAAMLYSSFDPATAWGPALYMYLAWMTSMLALTAWMPTPWRVRGLVAGGVSSAAWCIGMIPYGFPLNIAGHLLAAVLFFVTAWRERGGSGLDPAPPAGAPD